MSSSRFVLLVVVHVSNCYSNGFRKGSRAFRAVTYWVRSVALWRCPSSGWTADHGHGNLDFLQLTVGVEKRFWQITWVISESTHKLSRNLWCATACRGWRFGQESDAASCSLPLLLEYQCNSRSSQSQCNFEHNNSLEFFLSWLVLGILFVLLSHLELDKPFLSKHIEMCGVVSRVGTDA